MEQSIVPSYNWPRKVVRIIIPFLVILFHSGCIMPMMNRGASTLKGDKKIGAGTSMGVMEAEDMQFVQVEYFQRHSLTDQFELGYQLGFGSFFLGGQLYGKYQIGWFSHPLAIDVATGIYASGQDPSALEDEYHNNPIIYTTSVALLTDIGNTTIGPKFQWNQWIDGKENYLWPAFFIRHSFGKKFLISPELTLIRGDQHYGFQVGIGFGG